LAQDGTSNTILFARLPGYVNNSACGITLGGGQTLTVGSNWNSPTDRSSFGALSSNGGGTLRTRLSVRAPAVHVGGITDRSDRDDDRAVESWAR
jgi:hypothetical protein